MPPSESVHLHGKLYILEEDSHLHNEMDPTGRNFDRRHTVAINQREFNVAITHGLGIWWFADWPAGSYARQDPSFQPWLEKFQKLGTWAMQLDRSPRAEVAVLVDDQSFLYESVGNALDLPLIFRQRVTSLPRFGAAHDVYLLNDLLDGRLPDYKLYVFLNPFHLDDGRRARLKAQIRRGGKTALWLYAPGYLKDEPALENMTDLTGFRFDGWEPYATTIKEIYRDAEPARVNPNWKILKPTEGIALTQAVKHRKGRRLERVEVRAVFGEVANLPYAVHLERLNGTLRDRLNFLTRKSHGFAKEVATWDALFSLALFEHNWLRSHVALRVPLPAPHQGRRYDQRSPAMALALSDHIWSWKAFLCFPVVRRLSQSPPGQPAAKASGLTQTYRD
jgi:hypothetical protein